MTTKNIKAYSLPSGEYWIGDPCYAVPNEFWMEVCDASDCFKLLANVDGVQVLAFNTAYGDGFYKDNIGNYYGVDAGLIGIILASEVKRWGKDSKTKLGHIHTFAKPFQCYSNAGVLHFGSVKINTK